VTANVLLLPLSDYYRTLAENDGFIRRMIIDGIMMLKRKEPLPLIEEKMNSYLPPKKRLASSISGGELKKAA
jgi:chemotaxis protein MotA